MQYAMPKIAYGGVGKGGKETREMAKKSDRDNSSTPISHIKKVRGAFSCMGPREVASVRIRKVTVRQSRAAGPLV